jgi:hypothetical protein
MTTKAKCLALDKEHNLTIDYSFSVHSKYSSVDLPEGYLDYDGRTGLTFSVEELTAKEFWRAVYGDIDSIIRMKDKWIKDPDYIKAE